MRLLHERPPNQLPRAKLLLARHGRTGLNEGSKKDPLRTPVQGRSLYEPLSPRGHEDARLLGGVTLRDYLTGDGSNVEIVRTFTSGAKRGRDTLTGARAALLELGITLPNPTHDIRLAEFNKGGAEGIPLEDVQMWYTPEEIELRREYKEGWLFRHGLPHDPGETGLEAGARIYGALADILREPLPDVADPDKVPGILIVTHNVATSYGLEFARVGGIDPQFDRARAHMVPNGAVHIGDIYSGDIYFSPQVLTAAGGIACGGCVSLQVGQHE